MQIAVASDIVHPDIRSYDVAERKGVGHPDTLADAVAEAFAVNYSRECLNRFGTIANFWVDKVCLVGANAQVDLGNYHINKKVVCHLLGKITSAVGCESLDIERIFSQSVIKTLNDSLRSTEITPHLLFSVGNTSGISADHDQGFYAPPSASGLRRIIETEQVCNDSVICVGTGNQGVCARIAIDIENYINSHTFKQNFPATGTDVKVLAWRSSHRVEVAVAVPFHPRMVSSWSEYRTQVDEVTAVLNQRLKEFPNGVESYEIRLNVNTKDRPGHGYLAPFGTSLGKGDIGVVGRGNRFSGVIEPLRPAGVEAPAGKNPVHHAGKIYTALAHRAATKITQASGIYAEVIITARNGDPLEDPAGVFVSLAIDADRSVEYLARKIVNDTIRTAPKYHLDFLDSTE